MKTSDTNETLVVEQPPLHLLAFRLAGNEYAVEMDWVREIIQATQPLHLDGIPPYVAGLIKRRGRIIPVVDLRTRFGLEITPPTEESCVVIAKFPFGLVGLMADAVVEMVRVPASAFETPSRIIAGVDQSFIQEIAHLDDRLLVRLDFNQVFDIAEQKTLQNLNGLTEAHLAAEALPADLAAAPVVAQPKDSTETRGHQRVIFELAGELYGLPISAIESITPPRPWTPLPHSPDHILGLVNLHGLVVPVIDLRARFSLKVEPPTKDNRFIVLKGEAGKTGIAIWADAVLALVQIPASEFQATPDGALSIETAYCSQVARHADRLVVDLDLPKILADLPAWSQE